MEIGLHSWQSTSRFGVSGAFPTTRENPEENKVVFALPAVLITASGLQGEQPLVDRKKWIREVGKLDP